MGVRKGVMLVVAVGLLAFALMAAVPSAPPAPPTSSAASAGPVKAAASAESIYYNYSDFFNVPYGSWWDMRSPLYGDEPVGAQCFNATSAGDGTCVNSVGSLPRVAKYPYMDWAGPASAASMFAPYRLAVNGLYVPGYNLSQPVFLPVFNYSASPGNTLSFNWNMQYMTLAQYNTLTSSPLSCYSATQFKEDGYQLLSHVYITLDNQEAARLFGAQSVGTQAQIQNWWSNRILTPCNAATTGKSPGGGPIEKAFNDWIQGEANGKFDIYNGYDAAYSSFYTNMSVNVLSGGPTGLTQIYIEHGAWGTETLLDRWFYWGNATYAGNQSSSSKARGWWGMENGWWENVHYKGVLQATTMNFNLTGVLQYHFQEHSAPGPDGCLRQETGCTEASPSDDTPYWTWGPMLLDYVYVPSKGPYSELTRYTGLGYIKTTPGSSDYGTNTSFDYTPNSWVAKAGEWWNFHFPTNTSTYYQDPSTATFGTALPGAQLPPVSSTLSLMQLFPAGYGTWTGSTGTWSVVGGTSESWPTGDPGSYPYIPYPGIYLQPGNIPPAVTTQPATAISSTAATLNGNLAALGSAYSVDVGFLWGTNSALTGATNTTPVPETATGPFSTALTGLTNGQTYYFEAWAKGVTFVHGTILNFNTAATPPSATTVAASGVSTTGATLNGNLDSLGTASSVTVGFLWGTSASLTGATNTTPVSQSTLGPFSHALTGLTPATTYYFEAWALGVGFGHGAIMSFSTSTTYPVVVTDPATAVINTGATLNGRVTSLGSATSVTVGFLWGTSATLTGATNTTPTPQTATGPFSVGLSALTPSTTYYYEAWALGNGFATGAILSFTTGAGSATAPSVSTSPTTSVAATSANLGGALTNLGSANTVTVGFLWGTSATLASPTNTSAGSYTTVGSFAVAVGSLTPLTKYYVEAWANGAGFSLGGILNFTTAALAPAVGTTAASAVTSSGATLNGNVVDLGSASSVTVGFLWGTDAGLAGATNTTPVSQSATGAFTLSLTGLTPGTTYYYEAWTNGDGFAHGAIQSFTTPSEPTFLGLPALIGYGLVAAIVIVIVVIALVVLMMRRKRKASPPTPPEVPPANPPSP